MILYYIIIYRIMMYNIILYMYHYILYHMIPFTLRLFLLGFLAHPPWLTIRWLCHPYNIHVRGCVLASLPQWCSQHCCDRENTCYSCQEELYEDSIATPTQMGHIPVHLLEVLWCESSCIAVNTSVHLEHWTISLSPHSLER